MRKIYSDADMMTRLSGDKQETERKKRDIL